MARLPRRQVNITYIANKVVRNATFQRRKKGLTQKVRELSTLCGIEASAIIYNPDGDLSEVWPSPEGVQGVLSRFHNLSGYEQTKNREDHGEYIRKRIEKTKKQRQKQQMNNRGHEVAKLMSEAIKARQAPPNLNPLDFNDLRSLIDKKLKHVIEVLDEHDNNNGDHPPSAL